MVTMTEFEQTELPADLLRLRDSLQRKSARSTDEGLVLAAIRDWSDRPDFVRDFAARLGVTL